MTATANGSANGHAAPLSFATRAIHDGSAADTHTGAVIAPLSLSTTFVQDGVGNLRNGSYEYSRSANPNRRNLEEALASLEGGAEAFAFASGSAATATAVQALASADPTKVRKHVLAVNDVYGGTFRYLARVATEVQSLETTFLDLEASTEQEIYDAIREDTGLIWIETPTNPTLRVIDVATIVSIAQSHPAKPLVLVDNTFLSPFWSNPIAQGADLVLHSISKYINGHSDVIMGALIVRPGLPALADRLRFLQNAGGAIPSPFDCYLAHRGLKTLPLRGLAHGLSALKLARALEANALVESVVYPGLKSAGKAQATAKKAISGQAWKALGRLGWKQDEVTETEKEAGGVPFSGMVSFRIKGGAEEADAFLRASHLFALAESLGGVESLAEVPALMTHAGIPEAERAALGITSNLIRLSVGIEDVDDLVADVEQALRVAVHKN